MKRGPYFGRQKEHEEAISLRIKGLGYYTIADRLNNSVPVGTIRHWVAHIKIDERIAYEKSNRGRPKKSTDLLTSPFSIRKRLIEERGYVCSSCGIKDWLELEIMLEVHHKDGNKKNNEQSNISLLCPNCHSQTDNYGNKKRV